MNQDVKTPTAKIYQFPQRPVKTAHETPTLAPKIMYGNCWYHDDAINEAVRPAPPPTIPRLKPVS